MNKQIQDLIKEATTYRYTGLGEIPEFDREKFAELLIRECAEFIRYKAEKAMSQEILYVGNDLLEHFGVEE